MKKISEYLIVTVTALSFIACADDEKLPVDFDDLQVSGGAFAQELSTGIVTNINKLDPASSSFTKTYQLVSPNGGTDISKVEVFVNLDGENIDAEEALLYTFTSSDFNTGSGIYPELDVNVAGSDIINTLQISPDDLEGGDLFSYRLAVTNPDGTFTNVSANFDNQSADHTFGSTVICELPFFPAGEWTIELGDSYGDGWQTTTATGGPGIMITLTTGSTSEELEVNLASGSAGTETITVPEGTETAEWIFPGDFYGEISFTITSPSGNVVASVATGAGTAGPIALNLCNE